MHATVCMYDMLYSHVLDNTLHSRPTYNIIILVHTALLEYITYIYNYV